MSSICLSMHTMSTARNSGNHVCQLQNLPVVIFHSVCSYLTVSEKLLSLPGLSHQYQQLISNPYCFSHSHLHLTNEASRQLSGNPRLSVQLSLISSLFLSLDHSPNVNEIAFFHHLSTLELMDNEQFGMSLCSRLVQQEPSFFHLLTHLSFICLPVSDFPVSASFFPQLASVQCRLGRQRVSQIQQEYQLSLLLMLPSLTALDFDADYDVTPVLLRSDHLKQLHKFTLNLRVGTVDYDRFLIALFTQQQSGFRSMTLQTLQLHGRIKLTEVGFRYLAAFPALVTLDLRNTSFEYRQDFTFVAISKWAAADSHPLFPALCHLLLPRLVSRTTNDALLFANLLKFFASRLTILDWSLWNDSTRAENDQERAAPLQTVFRMRRLHKLALGCRFDPFAQEETYRIIHSMQPECLNELHTLIFDKMQLMVPSLKTLLSCTAQLQDLTMHDSGLNLSVLPIVGQLCPYIRSIKLVGRWNNLTLNPESLLQQDVRLTSTSISNSVPHLSFSRLQMIEVELMGNPYDLKRAVYAMLQLWSNSPLQYIRIVGYSFTCQEVLLFSAFSQLRSLILDTSHSCHKATMMLEQSTYALDDPGSDVDEIDHTEAFVTVEALAQRKGRDEEHSFPRRFRLSVIPGHEYADRQGVSAFFHDLYSHVKHDCIGPRQSNARRSRCWCFQHQDC